MKRGIANDEFDLSFMGVDEIFDAGVESPARFAGWIKKFDDRDLGASCAENWRMHSNELAHRDIRRVLLAKLALFVHECAYGKYHNRDDAGENKKSLFFHLKGPFLTIRRTASVVNAASDKRAH